MNKSTAHGGVLEKRALDTGLKPSKLPTLSHFSQANACETAYFTSY